MGEFQRPDSAAGYHKNFAPIKPLMTQNEAFYESARCLFCYDAPCVEACPTHINIPMFIRQIYTNNPLGAAETIYESNVFGFACGKVCPTEVLCEGACVYNHQKMEPIQIGRLQSYATQRAMTQQRQFYAPGQPNGKKVAIVGAGPAGIACACELRIHGYTVDIFEAKQQLSGLTVHGVAPYKITNEEVLDEMAYLQRQFQFQVHYQKPIRSREDFANLEKQYDAVFLGIGLGLTATLRIPGENLPNCIGAVEWIEQVRGQQHQAFVGKRVIVLGGGNTAMDAASESARLGAEKVILAYRRSKEEMKAYEFEYDLAKSVGVEGKFGVIPVAILGKDSVTGVKFAHTKKDHDGNWQVIADTEFVEPCDMVIKATGQQKPELLAQQIPGIKSKNGCIVVKLESYQTDNPQYFAAGDAVNGGKEVVNAVAEGKQAALGIHQYLQAK